MPSSEAPAPANTLDDDAEQAPETATSKPREKTILESPFFRADLVNGLMRDNIASPDFPLSSLLLILQIPAGADRDTAISTSQDQATSSLTPKNLSQLTDAIQALGAALALPEHQVAPTEPAALKPWLLRTTSLRVILGSCAFLTNNLVKAQSQFELVSDALRPPKKPTPKARPQVEDMLAQVQGVNFWLLQKCCSLQGKAQEADKFERWLKAWQAKNTEGLDWFQNALSKAPS